ncbi:MT-A70 family methyltransferase [Methylovirgula sp. HY1]|uniref:MT-A70 family methyltransferase n=1 Tax=Methylovirgula sp. HY1 TaxID=2822761 RepID=UPI001C74538B|nr:MT-A70 family methyltransferase [Methylovirgula sp. HY1]QXX74258.1 hypothetical protein MHY1_01068 [Methylovirgula sp. HY1]
MILPFHPYADLFPLIEGAEFDALVADVRANGLREPIVILDGQILDGRNRYRAALEAGLFCETDDLASGSLLFMRYFILFLPSDGDALHFVVSKNLRRRHLNDDQRRLVAARLVNMKRGRPSENPAECGIKVAEAAQLMNIDAAGTERARTVLAHAGPEIQTAIARGCLTVAAAAQAAKLEPEVQQHIAAEALGGRTNVVRMVLKRGSRNAREADLGAKQSALPTQKFGVILADPEWRFEPWSRKTGLDRSPDNHYPTSCAEVIAARDVASIAADDCVLFLWATAPMLPHALVVMGAWGFDYRTQFVWAKDRIGTGYWNRNRHELLLLGVKGHVPAPAPGTQWDSLLPADVGAHSEKPKIFLELIEAYFPHLPKIELNRRGPARPGWSAWGNEAEPNGLEATR